MNATLLRLGSTGLLFLLIFITGIGLSRSGRPFSTLSLTIHKLIGLAALIVLIVTVYQTNQAAALSMIEWTATAVTILLFAVTIIAGGLLSTDLALPAFVSILHLGLPFVTLFATGGTLLLLLNRTGV